MRKKKLIERIEQLEKVVEFLSKYDKNEIVQTVGWSLHNLSVKYLYNGEIKCVNIHCDRIEVIENLTESAIVRGDNVCFSSIYSRYYKIDKKKAIAQDIPKPAFVLEQELAEKKTEKKSMAKKDTKKCN